MGKKVIWVVSMGWYLGGYVFFFKGEGEWVVEGLWEGVLKEEVEVVVKKWIN